MAQLYRRFATSHLEFPTREKSPITYTIPWAISELATTLSLSTSQWRTIIPSYWTTSHIHRPLTRYSRCLPLLSNTTTTTSSSMIKSSTSSSRPSHVQTSGTPQPLPIRTTAIFSGIIGVLALVLIAILGRWVYLRWRKAKDISLSLYEHPGPENGMLKIAPFIMTSELFLISRSRQPAHTKS
jgi:hypothetical protein